MSYVVNTDFIQVTLKGTIIAGPVGKAEAYGLPVHIPTVERSGGNEFDIGRAHAPARLGVVSEADEEVHIVSRFSSVIAHRKEHPGLFCAVALARALRADASARITVHLELEIALGAGQELNIESVARGAPPSVVIIHQARCCVGKERVIELGLEPTRDRKCTQGVNGGVVGLLSPEAIGGSAREAALVGRTGVCKRTVAGEPAHSLAIFRMEILRASGIPVHLDGSRIRSRASGRVPGFVEVEMYDRRVDKGHTTRNCRICAARDQVASICSAEVTIIAIEIEARRAAAAPITAICVGTQISRAAARQAGSCQVRLAYADVIAAVRRVAFGAGRVAASRPLHQEVIQTRSRPVASIREVALAGDRASTCGPQRCGNIRAGVRHEITRIQRARVRVVTSSVREAALCDRVVPTHPTHAGVRRTDRVIVAIHIHEA